MYVKKETAFLKIMLALFGLSPYLHANGSYGQPSLRDLLGVELFVHTAGDSEIKKLENLIKERLKARLESANVPLNGSYGAKLKFLITGFKKKEGDYFIHASLQLHQRAYLAISHEYMDCQTWDTWKMGVFSANEILLEIEDMAREFANDYISANIL